MMLEAGLWSPMLWVQTWVLPLCTCGASNKRLFLLKKKKMFIVKLANVAWA